MQCKCISKGTPPLSKAIYVSSSLYVGASCNAINGLDLELQPIARIKVNGRKIAIIGIQFTFIYLGVETGACFL